MESFIFNAPGLPKTAAELARLRKKAEAMNPGFRAPQNVGEGLSFIGQAIASRMLQNKLDKADKTNSAWNAEQQRSLLDGFFPENPDPYASVLGGADPAAAGPSAPPEPVAGTMANGRAADRGSVPGYAGMQFTPASGSFDQLAPRIMTDLSRDFGLSPEQAAGVVGNLGVETGGFKHMQEINPLVPGSRGGYGWAQWTGPRRKQFESWVAENGLDPNSYEANYGFLKHEMTNTPEAKVLGSLRNAPDAASAASVFEQQFLRPGIPHSDRRVQYAQQALALAPQATATDAMNPLAMAYAPGASPAPDPFTALTGSAAPARGSFPSDTDPSLRFDYTNTLPDGSQNPAFAGQPAPMPPQPAPMPPLPAPMPQQPQMQPPQGMDPNAISPQGATYSEYADPMSSMFLPRSAPQGAQAPQQDAMRQLIIEAMTNPAANDQTRAMAQTLLQQMQPAKPDYGFLTAPDGTVLRTDKTSGAISPLGQFAKPPEGPKPTDDMREYELAKQQGFEGTFFDFQRSLRESGRAQNSVNFAAETEFEKATGKADAERFNVLATDGVSAQGDLARIQELRNLLSGSPGGVMTGLQTFASNLGIKLGENVGAIEAAQAIINQMVPTQRPAGSGTMSDRDVELFKSSLPGLMNTPDGNRLILDTMQAMTEYRIKQAEVADAVLAKEMTRTEGMKALRSLPNPIDAFRKARGMVGQAAPAGSVEPTVDDLLKKYGGGG